MQNGQSKTEALTNLIESLRPDADFNPYGIAPVNENA
jgi:hypothetical protein